MFKLKQNWIKLSLNYSFRINAVASQDLLYCSFSVASMLLNSCCLTSPYLNYVVYTIKTAVHLVNVEARGVSVNFLTSYPYEAGY
jgi:hypothetical protein